MQQPAPNPTRGRAARRLAASCGAALAVTAVPGLAQSDDLPSYLSAEARRPEMLWTTASDRDRIVWGQWTWHTGETREGLQNDEVLAVVWGGVFAGTFRTTHGPRGYVLGVERAWLSAGSGGVEAMLGFRTGLVYGYDERLGWLAGALPVLPFAQPMLHFGVGRVTAEVTHTWVVVSFTAGLRL